MTKVVKSRENGTWHQRNLVIVYLWIIPASGQYNLSYPNGHVQPQLSECLEQRAYAWIMQDPNTEVNK